MREIERIEGPGQLERLWAEAEELDPGAVPRWLEPKHAALYRRIEMQAPSPDVRSRLEEVGLVVDESGVYLADPTDNQIFAIGLATGSSPLELTPAAVPVLTREHVSDVTALFVADPFMLRREKRWYMYLEVWDWYADKGAIALASSQDAHDWTYEQVVLEERFHLSYPYVFDWSGETYLVPESFQAKAVRLYRATRFPGEWACEQELVAGEKLSDASPFRAAGRWWMLVGTGEHDTLRLFHAADLHGPWTEHPSSPVVEGDPVRARPAGRVVVEHGRLLRFAQRCDTGYGLDVRAFEITELTRTRYSERELPGPVLAAAGQGWNAEGMHHVDAHRLGRGRWTACVDGWQRPPLDAC